MVSFRPTILPLDDLARVPYNPFFMFTVNPPFVSTFETYFNRFPMKRAKDNFSEQASLYQKFRPGYPDALVDSLCNRVPKKNLAWDCGTGNGQIASMLSNKFTKVVATDISGQQLNKASQKENIQYKTERAENSSLSDASVDLIVVAQAIHWFDLDAFYREAKRVLKKDGVIAVIGYPLLTTENPKLDQTIHYFYEDVVGSYWDDERKYLDERYETIPFPFEEFHLPKSEMKYRWNYEQLAGYLSSWSAVGHYQKENGIHPLKLIENPLRKIFYGVDKIEVRFEVISRYGVYGHQDQ